MTDPVDPVGLEHGQVYLTHTNTGKPSLLISPQRLKGPVNLPGWFAVYMDDERELYKLAAAAMNKADELAKKRQDGEFPPLDGD